ncbi:NAD-dependent succinate-semialdehyde dehydrogenase [Acuticoccus sp. I52.16.1]|uniref:NAD-dependent succinate-semialdehyde dehydrogenase n=1 Tax=Acuticoccus sp. I52.16.1 TaxID=2928472 RepID=UPI001FD5EDB9|nr:NAD-dependent succinate-semialdehyde dehydrogenase [Acuticoccus sp. I52.16.1]UOM34474.1 NAD-dependent succinate-semialdehyde dehydrogenase [Acuticoccus sp. I52.16.1]
MAIATINPATGETLQTFAAHTDAEVDAKLAAAVEAFDRWRLVPIAERAAMLNTVADVLTRDRDALARLATLEMGKTLASSLAEVDKCAFVCRHYAEKAEQYLADEPIASNASKSWVSYQPLGPVLAVMPWNFPYWQVFRFAAPATAAGNVGLLKHASNVPQVALAIEKIFKEAGYPDGVFQTLLIGGSKVERVLRDDRVQAATLTGSEPAGMSVGKIAGEEIKHVVLELGGSDAFIVMPSADVEKAATTAVTARMINNGQSCIAAKRFIVHADVYDAFAQAFVAGMEAHVMGDPMEEATTLGPLATEAIRDELADQVDASVREGATVLTGGKKVDGKGWFYAPTVLADLPDDSPARKEEMFGPAAMLFKVTSLDEAIAVANETRFGLGSAAFTNDEAEMARFGRDLDAGCVFINTMVASDPRLPFGGVKKSGVGRELAGHGIREFVNVKTIAIA